jgi:integrase
MLKNSLFAPNSMQVKSLHRTCLYDEEEIDVRIGRTAGMDVQFFSAIRFLTEEEEGRLFAAAKEPLRTIILVGIYIGLRILAEALTLRWENVDLVRGLVTAQAAVMRKNPLGASKRR